MHVQTPSLTVAYPSPKLNNAIYIQAILMLDYDSKGNSLALWTESVRRTDELFDAVAAE